MFNYQQRNGSDRLFTGCHLNISRKCNVTFRGRRFTTRLSPQIKRTRMAPGLKKLPRRSPAYKSYRIREKSRRAHFDDRKTTSTTNERCANSDGIVCRRKHVIADNTYPRSVRCLYRTNCMPGMIREISF